MPDVRSPMTTVPAREGATVVLGSRVRVRDTDGEHEHTMVARVTVGATTGMRLHRITGGHGSALAQASDEVEIHTPGGVRLLTVVAVVTEAVPPSPRSARACEG
jgi:transcription elongation GreA/GreB family factor